MHIYVKFLYVELRFSNLRAFLSAIHLGALRRLLSCSSCSSNFRFLSASSARFFFNFSSSSNRWRSRSAACLSASSFFSLSARASASTLSASAFSAARFSSSYFCLTSSVTVSPLIEFKSIIRILFRLSCAVSSFFGNLFSIFPSTTFSNFSRISSGLGT